MTARSSVPPGRCRRPRAYTVAHRRRARSRAPTHSGLFATVRALALRYSRGIDALRPEGGPTIHAPRAVVVVGGRVQPREVHAHLDPDERATHACLRASRQPPRMYPRPLSSPEALQTRIDAQRAIRDRLRSGAEVQPRHRRAEADLQSTPHARSLSPEAVYDRARCTRIWTPANAPPTRASAPVPPAVVVALGLAAALDYTRAPSPTAARESRALSPTVVELQRDAHAHAPAVTASTRDLLAAFNAYRTRALPSRTACAARTCVRPREPQSVVRPLEAQTCGQPRQAQTCVPACANRKSQETMPSGFAMQTK
ncbi:hypothetical protein FB451DRAFT_1393888 [Mycena latifolia]|nr:hypothetical protein FB451DRAFT_1393888 [Mycena latifolia]